MAKNFGNLPNVTPVRMQAYERYLPTAFDNSLSILEKLNKLIHEMNKIGLVVNDFVDQWNALIDWITGNGLEQMVEDKLNEWMNDGTLSDIINNQIFGDIQNNISIIQDNLNDLRSELEKEKVLLEEHVYNINMFTGTATQRIQKALDYARDKGGGTVFIPTGSYNVVSELIIYRNTKLLCASGAAINRYHDGYMLMNGVRGESYSRYNGNGNITVEGGTWNHRGTVGGTGSTFAFAHADGLNFRNLTIKDANSHHMEINSSKNVIIENVEFLGLLSGLIYTEAVQLDLAFGSAGFPAFGSYDMTVCENVVVQNCTFGPSGTAGTTSIGRAFGSHSTRIGTFHSNIRFLNNTVNGSIDYAIQTLSYNDFVVDGNSFNDCAGGIIMYAPRLDNPNHMVNTDGSIAYESQDCTGYTISNNTFNNILTKVSVYVYGAHETGKIVGVEVSGNKFIGGSNDVNGCVVSRYGQHISVVSGNLFDKIQTIPVSFNEWNKYLTISNNQFNENFSSAVRAIDTCQSITISNNQMYRQGRHGIEIYGAEVTDVIISSNQIVGCNGRQLECRGIYIHSGTKRVGITGNMIRSLVGYVYDRSLYVTNTTAECIVNANIAEIGSVTGISAASAVLANNLETPMEI